MKISLIANAEAKKFMHTLEDLELDLEFGFVRLDENDKPLEDDIKSLIDRYTRLHRIINKVISYKLIQFSPEKLHINWKLEFTWEMTQNLNLKTTTLYFTNPLEN